MASSSELRGSFYSNPYVINVAVPDMEGNFNLQRWWPTTGRAVVVQNFSIESPIEVLSRNIGELTEAIRMITTRIEALEERLDSLSAPTTQVRQISAAEAKQEIKTLFEERHGEVLFPSDIADELNLEYDFVIVLLAELENEGKIAATEAEANTAPRHESG